MTYLISDVAALRAAMTGEVLEPGDAGYDEARTVWNGAIDHRPAVVARCAGPDDVAAALAYATARVCGWPSAVAVTVSGGRPFRTAAWRST